MPEEALSVPVPAGTALKSSLCHKCADADFGAKSIRFSGRAGRQGPQEAARNANTDFLLPLFQCLPPLSAFLLTDPRLASIYSLQLQSFSLFVDVNTARGQGVHLPACLQSMIASRSSSSSNTSTSTTNPAAKQRGTSVW